MAKTVNFQLGDVVSPEDGDAINWHRHDGKDINFHGVLDYYQDGGAAANAYAITPVPALTERLRGMPIYFRAAHTNTGASVLNDGLGNLSIKKFGTTALAAGDITAGQICIVSYDGAQYQLINALLPPGQGLEIVNGLIQPKLDGTSLSISAAGLKVTAWTQSIGASGYLRLPGGLILQWGFTSVAQESHATVTFPIAFPTAFLNAIATCRYTNPQQESNTNCAGNVCPISTTQMEVIADRSGGAIDITGVYWQAIGY